MNRACSLPSFNPTTAGRNELLGRVAASSFRNCFTFAAIAAFARQFMDVHEFLSQLALISNIDTEPALDQSTDTEAVNLSSVHQAKGLEYHTVFVIWLTDGMFPSTRSLETRDAIEEERRLFYVAITRARDELYLTFPHMRLSGGFGDIFQRPSRFLKEIPTQLIEDWQIRRQ